MAQNGQTPDGGRSPYTATVYQVMPTLLGAGVKQHDHHQQHRQCQHHRARLRDHRLPARQHLLDDAAPRPTPTSPSCNRPNKAGSAIPPMSSKVNAGGSGLAGWNASNNSSYGTGSLPLPRHRQLLRLCLPLGERVECKQTRSITTASAGPRARTMRFDIVQSATQTAIQEMENKEQVSGPAQPRHLRLRRLVGNDLGLPEHGVLGSDHRHHKPMARTQKNAGAQAAITAMQGADARRSSGDIANTNIGAALDGYTRHHRPGRRRVRPPPRQRNR